MRLTTRIHRVRWGYTSTRLVERTQTQFPSPSDPHPSSHETAPDAGVVGVEKTALADVSEVPRGLARIGRYHVLKTLGEGGMGIVYSAFDEELDRRIAIKVLGNDVVSSFRGRTRLMREAQAMAKLSHPNVVHVYEVGEVEGHIYIAMEFVRGTTLGEWLSANAHDLSERLAMVMQAGEGLVAAHASGIIHRDFKPDNVMVGFDARPRVLDFGLARGRDEKDENEGITDRTLNTALPDRANSVLSARITQHGAVMGTPAYMSPEQHFGLPTDAASDQFNFCVVLYEALYGERPFDAENRMMLAVATRKGEIQPPPPGSDVPLRLRDVLLRGLKTEPTDRWGSMRELLDALRDAASPPARRSPWIIVGVLLVGLLGVTAAWGFGLGRDDVVEQRPSAVETLAVDARRWGSRAQWVYPDPTAPEETALRAVKALRELEGELDGPGEAAADELSWEFASTLTRLGDQYWDAEGGRVFARDFYAQALLFDPSLEHARDRSGFLPSELADLRERAASGGFSSEELAAASELAELALPVLEAGESAPEPERIAETAARVRTRAQTRRSERSHMLAEPPVARASRTVAKPEPGIAEEPDAPGEPDLPDTEGDTADLDPNADRGSDAAAADPGDPAVARERAQALVAEARRLKQQGKRDAALKKMFEASRTDRKYAPAWDGLRDLHFQVGAYQEAVQYGEKAVKLAPRNGGYHLRLGEAHWKLRDYGPAESAWKTAQSLGVDQATDRLEALRKALGR
jgi:tetratricopeptide (TPR) repeat protein/predicted Ser/Thr protein kinase